jgi:hypothetical protein
VLQEALRSDDRHLGVSVDHVDDAAEVIDVRVGVDDRSNRAVPRVFAVQRQGADRIIRSA